MKELKADTTTTGGARHTYGQQFTYPGVDNVSWLSVYTTDKNNTSEVKYDLMGIKHCVSI